MFATPWLRNYRTGLTEISNGDRWYRRLIRRLLFKIHVERPLVDNNEEEVYNKIMYKIMKKCLRHLYRSNYVADEITILWSDALIPS